MECKLQTDIFRTPEVDLPVLNPNATPLERHLVGWESRQLTLGIVPLLQMTAS